MYHLTRKSREKLSTYSTQCRVYDDRPDCWKVWRWSMEGFEVPGSGFELRVSCFQLKKTFIGFYRWMNGKSCEWTTNSSKLKTQNRKLSPPEASYLYEPLRAVGREPGTLLQTGSEDRYSRHRWWYRYGIRKGSIPGKGEFRRAKWTQVHHRTSRDGRIRSDQSRDWSGWSLRREWLGSLEVHEWRNENTQRSRISGGSVKNRWMDGGVMKSEEWITKNRGEITKYEWRISSKKWRIWALRHSEVAPLRSIGSTLGVRRIQIPKDRTSSGLSWSVYGSEKLLSFPWKRESTSLYPLSPPWKGDSKSSFAFLLLSSRVEAIAGIERSLCFSMISIPWSGIRDSSASLPAVVSVGMTKKSVLLVYHLLPHSTIFYHTLPSSTQPAH